MKSQILKQKWANFYRFLQTFGSSTSETFDLDVNEETFNQFLRTIPTWDFVKNSKDHYLSLLRDEKLELMKNYIKAMKNEVNSDLFIYLFTGLVNELFFWWFALV